MAQFNNIKSVYKKGVRLLFKWFALNQVTIVSHPN